MGAQILQLFQGHQFHHFYWRIGHGGVSETPYSTLLIDRAPSTPNLGGVVSRLMWHFNRTWWIRDEVNAKMLRRYVATHRLDFDVAYVVVAREGDAARASSIVKCLGVPYVVNMVDVLESDGLTPATMPGIDELLRRARGHISLLPSITREMRKFINGPIVEIPPGKPASNYLAKAPADGEPVRMVISGRPYAGGCRFLATALKAVKEACRRVEIVYVGPHHKHIPPELKPYCRDAGFIENEEGYQRFLAEHHLAFLSGPDANDMYGKWSFPSRTVDYLMAGLPILACVPERSSTEDVLKPISPLAVEFTRKTSDLTTAINRFTTDKEAWFRASKLARSFAETTMSLETVRAKVFKMLESAAGQGHRMPN